MAENENDKEIVVTGPPLPVTPPEKKREKVIEKALEEERFGVLHVSREVGQSFSLSMLAAGVLLVSALLYFGFTGEEFLSFSFPGMPLWAIVFWVFLGIVNIVGGLLLMGSE